MDQGSSLSTNLGTASEVDLSGEVLAEKYRVLRALGRAAVGTTYLCQHETLDQQVALKVLRIESSRDPDVAARFERGAQAATRLDHVHAVRLLDFGKTAAGELYLALAHVEGRNLGRVLLDEGPMSDQRIVGIMSQLLSALSAAHALGLVHRDLTPENILLRDDDSSRPATDHVMVGDFDTTCMAPTWLPAAGHAAARHLHRAKPDVTTGTAAYISPEQARGEKPDARSDLYSAGVLLFQLLTGTQPFMAETPGKVAVMHCVTPPPPPSGYTQVNPVLETICLKALSKTREARFQSADEMQTALLAAVAHAGRGTAPRRSWLLPLSGSQLLPSVVESRTPSLAPTERVVRQPQAAGRRSITLLTAGLAAIAVATIAALPDSQTPLADPPATRARPTVQQQPAALSVALPPALTVPIEGPVANAPTAPQLPQPAPAAPTGPQLPQPAPAAPATDGPRKVSLLAPTTPRSHHARGAHGATRGPNPEQANATDAPSLAVAAVEQPAAAVSAAPASTTERADSEPGREERAVTERLQPTAAAHVAASTPPAALTALSAPALIATPAQAARPHERPHSTTQASVSIGAIATHAAVSKASVRNALNQAGLNHCYRSALDRGEAAARPMQASLDFATNMGGRIVTASLHATDMSQQLRQCLEQVVRAGRVREVDTGAAKASVELSFQPH